MSIALKIALTPVLVWQAVRTRRRMPRLPEAEGAREGVVGRGKPLHLLVAGDSSAAGVGVAHQGQALAAPMAERLAQATGRRVHWRLMAHTGLTTAQTQRLLREACVRADVAVVVTGVNDVIDQVPSHHAVRQRAGLVAWLQHHAGVQHVAFLPLPPVHAFHGLPQPLRWVAGSDARRHNRALQQWVRSQGEAVSLVELELPMNRGLMASDGFHPGEPAYRVIAKAAAAHLAAKLAAQQDAADGPADVESSPAPLPRRRRRTTASARG
jgi:lysophospholipase L1-like esterase